jgi:hypothetical protein
MCATIPSAWHWLDGQIEPVGNVRLIRKKGKSQVFLSDPDYLVVFSCSWKTIDPGNQNHFTQYLQY